MELSSFVTPDDASPATAGVTARYALEDMPGEDDPWTCASGCVEDSGGMTPEATLLVSVRSSTGRDAVVFNEMRRERPPGGATKLAATESGRDAGGDDAGVRVAAGDIGICVAAAACDAGGGRVDAGGSRRAEKGGGPAAFDDGCCKLVRGVAGAVVVVAATAVLLLVAVMAVVAACVAAAVMAAHMAAAVDGSGGYAP